MGLLAKSVVNCRHDSGINVCGNLVRGLSDECRNGLRLRSRRGYQLLILRNRWLTAQSAQSAHLATKVGDHLGKNKHPEDDEDEDGRLQI